MNLKLCAVLMLGLAVAGCHANGAVTRENGGTFGIKYSEQTFASGQRTKLYFNTWVNPDCTAGTLPTVRIVSQPKHGRITIVEGKDYVYFPSTNPRSACNTRQIPGEFVYYTPDSNYAGDDDFIYEGYFPYGGGGRVNMHAHIR